MQTAPAPAADRLARAAGWSAVGWGVFQPFAGGPATICAAGFALCGLLIAWRERRRIAPGAPARWALAFLGWLLIATLLSPGVLAWLSGGHPEWRADAGLQLARILYYWHVLILPAAVAWRVLDGKYFRRMWIGLCVGALANFVIGLVELATQVNLRWDLLAPWTRAHGVRLFDRLIVKLPENRAYGWFDHPLTFGGFICVIAFTAAGLALYAPVRSRLTAATAALGGVLFIAAKNRSYWMGLPAGVALLLWRKGRRAVLAAALAGALLFALAFALAPQVRSRAKQLLDGGSNSERVAFWKSGRDMLLTRPLTGWGVWGYRVYGAPYREPHKPSWGYSNFTHVHCTYLQLLVEGGLPLLGIFLALCGAAGAALRRRGADPGDAGGPLATGMLAAGAAFLVAALFEFSIGDKEAALPLVMLLGAALHSGRPAGAA